MRHSRGALLVFFSCVCAFALCSTSIVGRQEGDAFHAAMQQGERAMKTGYGSDTDGWLDYEVKKALKDLEKAAETRR